MSSTQRQLDDRAFISDPNRWPCWPLLPIKRGNQQLNDKNLGVLFDTDPKKGYRVYHCYLFDLPMPQKQFAQVPHTDYATVDALLADGWMVD